MRERIRDGKEAPQTGGIASTHVDTIGEPVRRSMRNLWTPGLVLGVTDHERDLLVSAYGVSEISSQKPMAATLSGGGRFGRTFTP